MSEKDSKKYILSVLTGPYKGSSYEILSQSIIVGRSSQCDIAFKKDNKVSRRHVRISVQNNIAVIENLTEKNIIFVNDKECKKKGFLSHESFFQLGDTKCQLRILDLSLAHLNPKAPSILSPQNSLKIQKKNELNLKHQEDSFIPFPKSGQSSKKIKFYIFIILIGAIFIFLMQENKSQKGSLEVLTQEQMDEKIKVNKNIVTALDKARRSKKKHTLQYREAFVHYTKGLRDYKKGVYRRAMVSFQACLSLFQDHVMCRRYYNLAKKKIYELVQYYMTQGKKSLDRYQFPACQTAYRNVMSLIQNRKNKTYKEARSYFLICKKRWVNRF